jgi:hypothetical protein
MEWEKESLVEQQLQLQDAVNATQVRVFVVRGEGDADDCRRGSIKV